MNAEITINLENCNDPAEACRYVANLIEEGYRSGNGSGVSWGMEVTKEDEIYYQPEHLETGVVPVGLMSWEVFETYHAARKWLWNHGFSQDFFIIRCYKNDDIEGHTYVNEEYTSDKIEKLLEYVKNYGLYDCLNIEGLGLRWGYWDDNDANHDEDDAYYSDILQLENHDGELFFLIDKKRYAANSLPFEDVTDLIDYVLSEVEDAY